MTMITFEEMAPPKKKRKNIHPASTGEVWYCHTTNSWHLYILFCKSGTYVGISQDFKARLKRHKQGGVPSTGYMLPIKSHKLYCVGSYIHASKLERALHNAQGKGASDEHLLMLVDSLSVDNYRKLCLMPDSLHERAVREQLAKGVK